MRRAIPSPRPFGLRRTTPPNATVASCTPQQLPHTGRFAAKAALAKSIWLRTAGVLSYARRWRAGQDYAVESLNRHALWQRIAIGDVDGRAIEIRPVQTQRGFEQFCIGLDTEAPELHLHCRRRAISDQDAQTELPRVSSCPVIGDTPS